jgi:hypothetical protein
MNTVDLLLWCLVGAAVIHSLEEYFGGFIDSFPPVIKGFKATPRIFWAINTAAIIIYILAASVSSYALWLGLAVPAASLINVVMHVGGAFKLKRKRFYSPGLGTAIFLYTPLSCLAYYEAWKANILSLNLLGISWVIAFTAYIALVGLIFTFAAFQRNQFLKKNRAVC